ncbi:MAG: CRISPR-associated endonuclease Cas1 [Bacteroidia bacterium]
MQLVINQTGTNICRRAGAFEIRNTSGIHKFSPEKIDSMLISGGVKLTADAILLAVQHEIDILFVDYRGQPQARIWSHHYGSISTIRKQQIHFATHAEGSRWLTGLLSQRLEAAAHLLKSLRSDRPAKAEAIDGCISTLESLASRIRKEGGKLLGDAVKARLRGWEGTASRAYFALLAQLVPEGYQFDRRSRRPAEDMFNCTLNYCYGILYGRVEIALIRAGIDPYLGVFHRDEHNRPVLVYDQIEAYRVWAEAVVLQLCFRQVLGEEMFGKKNGGLWLETLGKKVVITAMNDYLAEVVQYNHRRRSRLQHMQEDAHALAKHILSVKGAAEEKDL